MEHTADWELEVWAPDLSSLLEQAALGMYTLSKVALRPEERCSRTLSIKYFDAESLLVAFLSELLYLGYTEQLAFDEFQLDLEEDWLRATVRGGKIENQSKEIKAVTYHKLQVHSTPGRLTTRIVFDV